MRIQNRLTDHSALAKRSWSIHLLCKSLYLFLILKIIFIWPVIRDAIEYAPFHFQSFLRTLVFAPLALSHIHVYLFLIVFIALLVLSLFLKINYLSAAIIFWFSISLSKLSFLVTNGSDLILNIFLFIGIFLPTFPGFSSKDKFQYQILISNSALLLAQIQIALIYFLSGYDKLLSEAWRSGAAMHSILNLTFFQNPFVNFEFSEMQCAVFSWGVILFELGFSVLIGFKRFRPILLTMGVFFHLVIVFFLGLADFGLLMIIGYAAFLPIQMKQRTNSAYIANSLL